MKIFTLRFTNNKHVSMHINCVEQLVGEAPKKDTGESVKKNVTQLISFRQMRCK